MNRLLLASFAAICTAVSGLLLLDAAGLVRLDPVPRQALVVASAGLIIGFVVWAVVLLFHRS